MFLEILLGILLLFFFLLFYIQPDYIPRMLDRFRGRIPPGPPSYPFLGAMVNKKKAPWFVMEDWHKQYGPVFSLFLGTEFTVVLADQEAIKQGLGNMALAGRPLKSMFREFLGKAIGFSDGAEWKERRRVALTAMKLVGGAPGRLELESLLLGFTRDLITDFKGFDGKPVSARPPFDKAVILAMCGIIQNGAISADDPDFKHLVQSVIDMNDTNASIGLLNMFPWLGVFPHFSAPLKRMTAAMKFLMTLTQKNVVRRQNEPILKDEKPKDFLEAYRRQMEDTDRKFGSLFSEQQMVTLSVELLMGGAEDIIVMLVWLMGLMIHYPHIQRKCQALLDEVVGRDRLPTLSDKPNLGYLDAVIIETFRFTNNVPYPLPHRAMEEIVFMGHVIPKDSVIVSNFYSVHSDKEIWGDPDVFRPERFVDESGNFVQNGPIFSFSTGKRMCPGEAVAKMQVFCFFAAVLQNFDVVVPEGDGLPDFTKTKYGIS